MAYSTPADVKAEMPQTTSWGQDGLPGDTEIAEMIAEADSIVDDYCRGLYAVPFAAPVPDTIQRVSRLLAFASAREKFFRERLQSDEQTDQIRARAIKLLERIAAGVIRLDAEAATAEERRGQPASSFDGTTADRVFDLEDRW